MKVTENQSAAQRYYSPAPESLGSGIPVGSAIESLNLTTRKLRRSPIVHVDVDRYNTQYN
jgi:hypothetical protein